MAYDTRAYAGLQAIETYGDMLRARRWLIVQPDKEPASGWTHPRILRADKRQGVRISKTTKNGGVMCTATTPKSWLTFAEAAAICSPRWGDGWRAAYVHNIPGADDQFIDFDVPKCESGRGNTLAEFAEWRDGIIAKIQALRPDSHFHIPETLSGGGRHVLFRIPPDEVMPNFPDVFMPCKCGDAACKKGGKAENWIGKGNRYRIQANPIPPETLDEPLPELTRAMLATIPEFAEAYSAREEATELPPGPEYSKTQWGAAWRNLLYVITNGIEYCADLSADTPGYFFATPDGWAEFGSPDSPQSFALAADAAHYFTDQLETAGVTESVIKGFREYARGQLVTRNLPEQRRAMLTELSRPDFQANYRVNHVSRGDFNSDAGRYLRTRAGFHDLMDGGRVLDAPEVIDAMLTADMPGISQRDESRYSAQRIAAARELTDTLVLGAWGVNKFQTLLWHSQRRKGNLFVIGGRNRGKGLLLEMLQALGFAAIFPWAHPGCPNGRRKPQFDDVAYARTRLRLVAMDEVTGSRVLGDTDVPDDEKVPHGGDMKDMQSGAPALIERKHQDAVYRAIVSGVVMIANAAPCIDARAGVYAETSTHYIGAPERVDALAAGGLGAARRVLETAPALNRLRELLLEHMPQVANSENPPLSPGMLAEQDALMDECQAVYNKMEERKKKAAAKKDGE